MNIKKAPIIHPINAPNTGIKAVKPTITDIVPAYGNLSINIHTKHNKPNIKASITCTLIKLEKDKVYMKIKEVSPLADCWGKINLNGLRMTLPYLLISESTITELKSYMVTTKQKKLLQEDSNFSGMILPITLCLKDEETLLEVKMCPEDYWVRVDKEFCNYIYSNPTWEVVSY